MFVGLFPMTEINPVMLLNYLKIAIRLLFRNPALSLINVGGLSIGFFVFFILWQYTNSELATDQFHPDWQRIVRCGSLLEWTDDGDHWEESKSGVSSFDVIDYVTETYPEIESYTRIMPQIFFNDAANEGYTSDHGKEIALAYSNEAGTKISFLEEKVIYADTNLFQFFTIPLLKGDPKSVLSAPASIVLSHKRATSYFGDENPVGRLLVMNDSIPLVVTGVFDDFPSNTHLDFDVVLSFKRVNHTWRQRFLGLGTYAYFKLNAGTNAASLETKINDESRALLTHIFWGNWNYGKTEILLQPLAGVAFQRLRWDTFNEKSPSLLRVFQGSAWVILGMAWINYIILTTSFNLRRFKEQVVRKTNGARIRDMLVQFVTESAMIHIIAILIAASIIQIARQPLWLTLGFYIAPWSKISLSSIGLIVSLTAGSILLTGLYPATVALKQAYSNSTIISIKKGARGNTGQLLTTLQFSVAIVMIICVFIVFLQNHYILAKQIGLNRDQVLVIDLPIVRAADFEAHVGQFITDIAAVSGGGAATRSYSVAGNGLANYVHLKRPDKKGGGLNVESDGGVDENFIPFYDIRILAGRNFAPDSPANDRSIILSEAAAQRIGFARPEDAIGRLIQVDGAVGIEIIAIINDYQVKPYLNSVHAEDGFRGKAGLALTYRQHINAYAKARKLSVRISPAVFADKADVIKSAYGHHFADAPFRYSFLDDQIHRQYQNYNLAFLQIIFFTLIAIGIACVGLLGVMTNNVVSRTKELGIRKVLGASMFGMASLLVSDTVRQVAVASLVGLSLSVYLSRTYLEEFTERISPSWWHYVYPVLLFFVILIAVIYSILAKAATKNPVESLRHE
jgi:putative ABC transport system permease protein